MSDHPPNPTCEADISVNPKFYQQKKIADMLDRKKRKSRLPRNRSVK